MSIKSLNHETNISTNNKYSVIIIGNGCSGKTTLYNLLTKKQTFSQYRSSISSEPIFETDSISDTVPNSSDLIYKRNPITIIDTQGLFDSSPINDRITSSNSDIITNTMNVIDKCLSDINIALILINIETGIHLEQFESFDLYLPDLIKRRFRIAFVINKCESMDYETIKSWVDDLKSWFVFRQKYISYPILVT